MARRPSRKVPMPDAAPDETASSADRTRDLARRYLDLWERQVAIFAAGSAVPPALSAAEPAALAGRAAELINIGAVAMGDMMAASVRAFAAVADKGGLHDGATGEQRSEPAAAPALLESRLAALESGTGRRSGGAGKGTRRRRSPRA